MCAPGNFTRIKEWIITHSVFLIDLTPTIKSYAVLPPRIFQWPCGWNQLLGSSSWPMERLAARGNHWGHQRPFFLGVHSSLQAACDQFRDFVARKDQERHKRRYAEGEATFRYYCSVIFHSNEAPLLLVYFDAMSCIWCCHISLFSTIYDGWRALKCTKTLGKNVRNKRGQTILLDIYPQSPFGGQNWNFAE